MKKIAIIGGGAAGVGALWALRNSADVHLFEKESQLGGHAFTYDIDLEDETTYVDMGVEYFNERLSPNLFALFKELGIETYVAPLSFCAYQSGADRANYWSNSRLGGNLSKRFNQEMNRFQQAMIELAQNRQVAHHTMTIGDFLDAHQYSKEFQQLALLPMMTTFSGCKAPSLDYSLMYVAMSFAMNLLSFFSPCHWRKVKGGVTQYLKKITKLYPNNIHLNSPIKSVKTRGKRVLITLNDNSTKEFDDVIFACQAEIALALLEEPTELQQSLLSQFEYVNVTSTLHNDATVICNDAASNEYFQFQLTNQPDRSFAGYLSRINQKLYPYQSSPPIFVSFDQEQQVDNHKIIISKHWRLPKLRPKDLGLKKQIHKIQGQNNLWFCGTDFTLTGHEGAFVSGLVIATRLGADYPFADSIYVLSQFNIIREFMGVYTKRQALVEKINRKFYHMVKRLNLHKRLSHYYTQEFMY